MHKKLPLFFLFLATTFLEAEITHPLSARIGAGAFIPESSVFQEIYGVSPIYHVQLNYAFVENLSAFANVSLLWQEGSTSCCSDSTSLELFPLSLGLLFTSKYSSKIQAYFGGGGAYSFLWIDDNCRFVNKEISNHRFGAVLKSGLIILRTNFSLQIFVDALFQKFHFKTSNPSLKCHEANLNALIVGGAIGWRI